MSTASASLEELFAGASWASEEVASRREVARREAVRAIRRLEGSLRQAVAGDTIRGLANLNPVRGAPAQQAARVVGPGAAHKMDAPVAFGTRAIVLAKDGALVVLEVGERGELHARAVRDDELTAQDLDAVVETTRRVLERHVERASRTASNYARISELAGALCAAVR